jgi:hypothetical protein
MSTDVSFSLTSRGLANVSSLPLAQDFTFVISGEVYPCNRLFASFISPIVCRALKTDPFISSFTIDLPDPTRAFPDVLRLMHGASVDLTAANATFLGQVGRQLDNRELILCVRSVTDTSPTLSNSLELICVRHSLGLSLDTCARFIAANLMNFPAPELGRLPMRVLEIVLLSPTLLVDSETWLLDFVISTVQQHGEDYRPLFACVAADYLQEDDLQRFLSHITLEDLTLPLWQCLCRRLAHAPAQRPPPRMRYSRLWETYALAGNPLEGILHHLLDVYGEQSFTISASSFGEHARRFVSSDPDSRWQSANVKDSWLVFDFHDLRVKLAAYSIRSYRAQAGSSGWHLRSWRLCGSNDEAVWTVIDTKTNCDELNGPYKLGTWLVDGKDWYRFVKLQIADLNHAGTWAMTIAGIEFFGDVMGEKPVPST